MFEGVLSAWVAAAAGVLQLFLAVMHLRMSDRQALVYLGSLNADDYWQRRLRGTLWAGSFGRDFTGLVILIAAGLLASSDPSRPAVARVLLGASVLPISFSLGIIPLLCPEDSRRALTHGVVVVLVLVAMASSAL